MIPSIAEPPAAYEPSPYLPRADIVFRTVNGCFESMTQQGARRNLDCRDPLDDLGNLFVMNPGFVAGDITLRGPDCGTGLTCVELISIQRPDDACSSITFGASSFVGASRVDYAGLDPGRAFATIKGQATSPTTWLGSYNMSLAALNLEPTSVWNANVLDLQVKNPDYPNAVGAWGSIYITDRLMGGALDQPFTITAGQTVVNDHNYCLSEITLTLVNRSGLVEISNPEATSYGNYGLHTPQVDPLNPSQLSSYWAQSTFRGTPANYTPGNGRIHLRMPTGDFVITPSANYRLVSDGTLGNTQFPPFSMKVGCQVCYAVSITEDGHPGPIINLATLPSCASQAALVLQGAIEAAAGHQITRVTYSINSGTPVELYSGSTAVYDLSTSPLTLVPCANTVTIEATDEGGLSGTATFTIKYNPPPVFSGCANKSVQADAGQSGTVVSFTVGALDACNGAIQPVCNPPSGSFFPIGDTEVTCTVTGSCGNSSTCTFVVSVSEVDRTPPTIQCPGNFNLSTDLGRCSAVVTFTATASDDRPGATYACVPSSGSAFPKGTTTVRCTATDAAGNTASCSFTVRVNDTEKPTAECRPTTNPAGGQIPTAGNNPKSGQNPDGFYQLLATDNCDTGASLKIFIKDMKEGPCGGAFVAGPYKPGDKVKLTQSPGQNSVKPMAGVVIAHINTIGDPVLVVTDSSGNTSICHSCLVPPKPK